MSIAKLGAALIASLISLAAAVPANAASPISEAFLANARPNIDFLERSNRVAVGQASAPAMRAFARDGVADASATNAALDVLSLSDHRFALATTSGDGVITGRSAHVVTAPKPAGFGQAANARMPVGSPSPEVVASAKR